MSFLDHNKCPYCKGELKSDAKICIYCKKLLKHNVQKNTQNDLDKHEQNQNIPLQKTCNSDKAKGFSIVKTIIIINIIIYLIQLVIKKPHFVVEYFELAPQKAVIRDFL